jgi:hypothetical protein
VGLNGTRAVAKRNSIRCFVLQGTYTEFSPRKLLPSGQ